MSVFFKKILISLTLALSTINGITAFINHANLNFHQANAENSFDLDSENIEEQNREITFTYFNGIATDVDVGDYVSSYFNYYGQHKYFRFTSSVRQCISLNYSGPSASLRIFYSNFFLDSDYLVSIPYINNAIDCYMFENDCEYIIEFTPYSIATTTPFSFHLESLTLSTLANHTKYAIHQTMDSSSNVGYHYEMVYFNVGDSYTLTNSYTNSYSTSTNYANVIDSTHWFFDPTIYYNITDNRRVVVDTGYDEYSSIAYAEGAGVYNTTNYGYEVRNIRFTGTFISETVVISCAHGVLPAILPNNSVNPKETGMLKKLTFRPGINDYSNNDYYGTYTVTELYTSISYILGYYSQNKYAEQCADYDWSILKTTKTINGQRTHSYMGISGYSYSDSWSFARSAGYPSLTSNTSDTTYMRTMWASFPLENSVTMVNGRITSSNIIISRGNSGGPLYYKYTTIQNGTPTIYVTLLGIVSGYNTYQQYTSYFYRNTGIIVNIAKTIMGLIS